MPTHFPLMAEFEWQEVCKKRLLWNIPKRIPLEPLDEVHLQLAEAEAWDTHEES